jgi:hypothetical protein
MAWYDGLSSTPAEPNPGIQYPTAPTQNPFAMNNPPPAYYASGPGTDAVSSIPAQGGWDWNKIMALMKLGGTSQASQRVPSQHMLFRQPNDQIPFAPLPEVSLPQQKQQAQTSASDVMGIMNVLGVGV